MTPPWWTEADQAEFDLIANELVKAGLVHRDRCSVCSQRLGWCDAMREALEIVEEWRADRILRSKAAWLRLQERLREATPQLRVLTGGRQ